MIENLYQFRQMLREQGVYLSFTGPLSQSLLEDVVEILRQKMTLEGVKTSTVMQVFSMAVEQVQNMIRYSAETVPEGERHAEFRLGILIIGYENGQYFVLSGNLIKNTKVDPLRERLMTLRRMTKDELNRHYKEQRKKPLEPGSQGAGLGFIEMARKARHPLEFDFQKIDEQVSFFSIKTII
jgi:hypothetical protein